MLVLLGQRVIADATNAFFEGVGSLVIWRNVQVLLKDKQVRGVDWRVTIFMSAWGGWNLWYYPHLGQWLSFWAGVFMCTANCVWLALAVQYRNA